MGSTIWTPGGEHDPRRDEAGAQAPPQPGPEELIEQIRRLKVSDVVLSTMSTVAQLGYAKLEPASRDLEQARLAVEALRALVPVVQGAVPADVVRDFGQVVANLQLAYATAVDEEASSKRDDGER